MKIFFAFGSGMRVSRSVNQILSGLKKKGGLEGSSSFACSICYLTDSFHGQKIQKNLQRDLKILRERGDV